MKRFFVFIGLFIFCSGLIFSLSWAEKVNGPKMVLGEKVFDFKEVDQGTTLKHAFRVLNSGDQPLEIKSVKPGWGCTVAYFDERIPPGGEGKIVLSVKTSGYEGQITKTSKVYSNDPLQGVEVLTVKALVKAPIYLSSRYVYLQGSPSQPVTKSIDIKAGKSKPLRLEPGQFNLSEKVTYQIEEVEVGKIFRIHFTSIPGPAQVYQGFLKLKTNYPEKPEITIRIRGVFKG
jgi:hypothetical protein